MSNRRNSSEKGMPVPPSVAAPVDLLAQNDTDAAKATMMDKGAEEQEALAAGLEGDFEEVAKVDLEPRNDSTVKVKSHKRGIEVMATRAGYFAQSRKAEGDRFFISDMSELGSWMQLMDSKAEAKRQANDKAKALAAAKKAADVDEEESAE